MITINKILYLFTLTLQLLDKDAKTRLGGTECMHGDVREQEFFHPVHWDKLERRELETPFKPRVVILFIIFVYHCFMAVMAGCNPGTGILCDPWRNSPTQQLGWI